MGRINFERIESVELVEVKDYFIYEYTEDLKYSFDNNNTKTYVYKVIDKKEFYNNINNVYVTEDDLSDYIDIDYLYICIQLDDDIYLVSYKNKYYSLVQSIFDSNKTDLIEYEEKEEVKSNEYSSFLAVRWAGAFNTETVECDDFERSLLFELSSKDRQVACDLFENSRNLGINNILYRCLHREDFLYKKCKLAFIYNSDSIVKAYAKDVWSANVGRKLIATSDGFDEYWQAIDKSDDVYKYKYHLEAYLETGAKPTSILIINKKSWNIDKLNLVERYAKEFNLNIIYFDFDYDDYNCNYYKLLQSKTFRNETEEDFWEEAMWNEEEVIENYKNKDFYMSFYNMNIYNYISDQEFEKEYERYYRDYEKIDRL